MKHLRVLILSFLSFGLAACASPTSNSPVLEQLPEIEPIILSPGEKLNVLASTGIIADVVANVAGNDISLTTLIAPGQDPHTYEPAPQAVAAIETADIIFVNGFGFEEVLLETIRSVASGIVVPVSAGIDPLTVSDRGSNEADPHVWVIPANGIVWTENVAAVLSAADPSHASSYLERGALYIAELKALEDYIRSQVDRITPDNRKLVTGHEMLTYFAVAYDFELLGALIPAASTSAGASPGDLAALIETIRRENVPAIFVSASAGEGLLRLADSLSQEVGASLAIVPLLTGSLASPGQPGDTYIGYLRYNIDQIVLALID